MKASKGGVPYRPNKNHVMPRIPTHPNTPRLSVNTIPILNFSPVCWAIQGVIASISSRYRNSTSKNITNSSTMTIWIINLKSRPLMASISAWTQAKLPIMRRSRKRNRTGWRNGTVWSEPTRSASTSDIVGNRM